MVGMLVGTVMLATGEIKNPDPNAPRPENMAYFTGLLSAIYATSTYMGVASVAICVNEEREREVMLYRINENVMRGR